MTNGSDREQFAVSVVWHPDYASGSTLASQLKHLWAAGPYREVLGEKGLNVSFRYATAPGSPSPRPIDWEGSHATAVVVLLDGSLATEPPWRTYVSELEEQADRRGYANRVFPVAMEADVLGLLDDGLATQAIRWDTWPGEHVKREARLKRELTHQFCRMLRYSLTTETDRVARTMDEAAELRRYSDARVRIFLSYATRDDHGKIMAERIRDWIHANSDLGTFFAVADIPPGLTFSDTIDATIPDCAMVACYSDSYSSREWCRREVIAAKKCGVPMLVVDCLRDIDDRVFPYLGNVPMMRVDSRQGPRLEEVVSRVLDEVFRELLWKHRIASVQQSHADVAFTLRRPELFTLATLPLANDKRKSIVHPGAPIGEEEKELFGRIDPSVQLQTVDEWYVGNRS